MNKRCFGKLHYTILSIVLMLSSVLLQAQSNYNTTNWRFSNPRQFGFTVFDVDFFDNNVAVAVGSDGGIARTTDGGINWTYGPFTYVNNSGNWTKPSLLDVHFVTANVVYASGTNALIKSTDGGVTWSFIQNPLSGNNKNVNTVWFTDANRGYIAGQWNTLDSIPKLYFTNNGGATWDSLNAPTVNGRSRVGYINNPNLPPLLWDVNAKGKEIWRIEFSSPTVGYITGGGSSLFPPMPAANSSTCLPTGGTVGTSGHNAALVWKYNNGVLTDYSLSKERLGYSGINTNTVTCTTQFNSAGVTPTQQQYRAINIVNDSLVLLMSFNNNCVVRVHTGRNDSTNNMATGLNEAGRYQIMNFPFPPTGGPQAGSPIPNPQVLLASNPYHIKKASNGKLYATGNFGRWWTSVDTGRNWVQVNSLPQNQLYSQFGTWALDIAPNGKFLAMGTNGVKSDSIPGSPMTSNYNIQVTAAYTKMDFADCNNGIAVGGGSIAITNDGGTTWFDRTRTDFVSLFININGVAYVPNNPAKAYFATSVGNLYKSDNANVIPPAVPTLDPVLTNGNEQMHDVATVGNDSVWVCGYSGFSIPAASRSPKIFRSTNGGLNWTTLSTFPAGSTSQTFTQIEFPSRLVGYVAGNRDTIWKTTDGGITWNKLPLPTPGVTPQITYTDMFALNENVVYLTGNGFPRKVVFRTTDGGATWQDITNNILTSGGGNINAVVFHDLNNGYVLSPGGYLFKTNNGGASWTLDIAPTNILFNALVFAPKKPTVPVPFENRKLFVTGAALPNVFGHIMEYGNPANVNVNSTETIVNASCTNLAGGSITVNATGGIAPYTYSINGGPFQSSNSFTGLTQGAKTITVKDSYCGTLTKTINITFTDDLTLTTNNDTLVCAGAPVQMQATTNGASTTYSWSPSAGLSATNISNPVAITNNAAAYTVTATLNGCVRTKTVNVGIKPNPFVSAGPDKTIMDGDYATLQGNGAQAPQSISWTPTATITNGGNTYQPVVKPSTTTTYTLTVRDQNNCTSTDNVVVNVIPYCLSVKNAFTPNGDGINDQWIVTNSTACYTQLGVVVFNRYGGVVYKNDNYQNNWNGMYNGKPVADGTYYYTITLKLINGRTATASGDVTILR
jgi:gliding motility-associated-like protein